MPMRPPDVAPETVHTLKPGQCPFHIRLISCIPPPAVPASDAQSLHDATRQHCASAGEERLTGRDGLQLVRVTAGHSTTATGRNQGVCPCLSVLPTIESLIEREQRVAEIRRFSAALLQLRVSRKDASVCASTRRCASHRPHGAWAPAPQPGTLTSPAACSRLTSPPELSGLTHTGIPLYHRETVGRFRIIRVAARCPDVNAP